jgi:hypothetical protein
MASPRPVSLFLSIVLASVLLQAAPGARAQARTAADAPLQERMSYAQFTRLGLDKLSPTQLKALNAWLHAHGDRGPSVDAIESARATRAERAEHGPNVVHTHIVGTFRGWGADTVFTLANGQRWEVAGDSELMIHSMKDPKVTLRKSMFGSWLLNVDGVNQSVHVTPAH